MKSQCFLLHFGSKFISKCSLSAAAASPWLCLQLYHPWARLLRPETMYWSEATLQDLKRGDRSTSEVAPNMNLILPVSMSHTSLQLCFILSMLIPSHPLALLYLRDCFWISCTTSFLPSAAVVLLQVACRALTELTLSMLRLPYSIPVSKCCLSQQNCLSWVPMTHQEQLELQCHFDMCTAGAGDQTANPAIRNSHSQTGYTGYTEPTDEAVWSSQPLSNVSAKHPLLLSNLSNRYIIHCLGLQKSWQQTKL